MKTNIYDITIQIETPWYLATTIQEVERIVEEFSRPGILKYCVVKAEDVT